MRMGGISVSLLGVLTLGRSRSTVARIHPGTSAPSYPTSLHLLGLFTLSPVCVRAPTTTNLYHLPHTHLAGPLFPLLPLPLPPPPTPSSASLPCRASTSWTPRRCEWRWRWRCEVWGGGVGWGGVWGAGWWRGVCVEGGWPQGSGLARWANDKGMAARRHGYECGCVGGCTWC